MQVHFRPSQDETLNGMHDGYMTLAVCTFLFMRFLLDVVSSMRRQPKVVYNATVSIQLFETRIKISLIL